MDFKSGESFARTVEKVVLKDDYNRKLISHNLSNKKKVGIFYFLWLGQYDDAFSGEYNVSRLMNDAPNELWNKDSDISPENQFHYWGEPMYGYYHSDDEWVMKKHLELLTYASVDFIALDVTNADIYLKTSKLLLSLIDDYRKKGFLVPQVIFYCNTETKNTIEMLYREIYSQNLFFDAWYMEDGKPLIIGNGQKNRDYGENIYDLSDEIKSFFAIRPNIWPQEDVLDRAVSWIEWCYPQRIIDGWTCVSPAQHVNHPFSRSIDDTADEIAYHSNWGRGYDFTQQKNIQEKAAEGWNFEQQWETVHQNRDIIDTVFITGWNEWVAQKLKHYPCYQGKYCFVDNANLEFSRDIEMTTDEYMDNFYLQMVRNIHLFKCEQKSEKNIQASNEFTRYSNFIKDGKGRHYKNVSGKRIFHTEDLNNWMVHVDVSNSINDPKFILVFNKALEDIDGIDIAFWFLTPKGERAIHLEGKSGKQGFVYQSMGGEKYCEVEINKNEVIISLASILPKELTGFDFQICYQCDCNIEEIKRLYATGDCFPIGRLKIHHSFI